MFVGESTSLSPTCLLQASNRLETALPLIRFHKSPAGGAADGSSASGAAEEEIASAARAAAADEQVLARMIY